MSKRTREGIYLVKQNSEIVQTLFTGGCCALTWRKLTFPLGSLSGGQTHMTRLKPAYVIKRVT